MRGINYRRLVKVAEQSNHHRYLHSVLIFAGSKFLTSGYNSEGIHAEVRAIRRLARISKPGKERKQPRNLHLISFMLRRNSRDSGNSRPCASCERYISESGIKKITFFEDGKICQLLMKK